MEELCVMIFQPTLLDKIRKYQREMMDQRMNELLGEEVCTQMDGQGLLRFSSRIGLPDVKELKDEILQDALVSSIHCIKKVPRCTRI